MAQLRLDRRIRRQPVRRDIQLHGGAQEPLKEGVMKLPGNAGALGQPLFKPQIELAGDMTNTQAISRPERQGESRYPCHDGNPAAPPWRQDLDANPDPVLAPCTPAGAALDA